jgi:hypothetical protein
LSNFNSVFLAEISRNRYRFTVHAAQGLEGVGDVLPPGDPRFLAIHDDNTFWRPMDLFFLKRGIVAIKKGLGGINKKGNPLFLPFSVTVVAMFHRPCRKGQDLERCMVDFVFFNQHSLDYADDGLMVG